MIVLLVEDDMRVADFICRGLRAEGHAVTAAHDGPSGLDLAVRGSIDVIILDQMLPGITGKDICTQLRTSGSTTPILMLTAMDTIDDRVSGLRAGADDYLVKPFSFDELIARLEALVRRSERFEKPLRRTVFGDITFDRDAMRVTRAGTEIALTAKELGILDLLMTRPDHVHSRERILNLIWGYDSDPLTNVVDVYVARLRKKLDAHGPTLIETVRGAGYRMVAAGKPARDNGA